jgi:hypothetical protein
MLEAIRHAKFDSAPILGPQRRTLSAISTEQLSKPTMPPFSIPNSRSHGRPDLQSFLSPRKSLVAVGVVCSLSAAALLVGRTPSPTPAVGADIPTQLQADPGLDSHAPHRK